MTAAPCLLRAVSSPRPVPGAERGGGRAGVAQLAVVTQLRCPRRRSRASRRCLLCQGHSLKRGSGPRCGSGPRRRLPFPGAGPAAKRVGPPQARGCGVACESLPRRGPGFVVGRVFFEAEATNGFVWAIACPCNMKTVWCSWYPGCDEKGLFLI